MTQNWKEYIQQFPISNPSTKMLVDLSHYGVIKVSGADAAKFLQGQLSCDVTPLQSGEHTLGAYCNIKGRVESLFRLWRLEDNYFLRMLDSLVESTLQELQKYAIFSKVKIENVSSRICGFGVANHKIELDINDTELAILPITPQMRYEIYGPCEELKKVWQHCIVHASHVDPYMWDILDVENSIPELYPQTVGEFFPHDLNLHNLGAVSFTKGCFRGQEIVARMQHRGKLKRSLNSFRTEHNHVHPGDKITSGGAEQEMIAGTVVRTTRHIGNGLIGLAVITDALAQEALCTDNKEIVVN